MILSRLNVNDSETRRKFLELQIFEALSLIESDRRPLWGHFTPQQMVEHLLWATEVSTGKVPAVCSLPPKLLERFRPFLFNDQPTSREFMNPMLKRGLPALRYAGMTQAVEALRNEIDQFLQTGKAPNHQTLQRVHPVFGPLTHEEWERSHYKHFYHHLLQFDLLRETE
jgi:hypothetical protein